MYQLSGSTQAAVDYNSTIIGALELSEKKWVLAVQLPIKKQGFAPDVLVTDKLRSYGAAQSEIGLSARHEQGLRTNNRAENSHQPTRRRERKITLRVFREEAFRTWRAATTA
jgi:transposase-like protein